MNAGAVECGQDDDVHVEQLHADDPARDAAEPGAVRFCRPREEESERHEEPEDNQEPGEYIPGFGISDDEVLRLLGDVGVPIKHVLAKADVGPENGKGEEPFPHDVVMLDRDHALQITGSLQRRRHQNQERHRTARGAGKDVWAPHGREPMPVKAHQPIESPKSQTEREKRETNEGRLSHPDRELRIAVAILADGKTTEQVGDDG